MPFRIWGWEIALLIVPLAIYFVPTIIATARHVRNMLGIILLNIFGGWTFVGWIIALIWSIRGESQANYRSHNP